jgi:TonB family protein
MRSKSRREITKQTEITEQTEINLISVCSVISVCFVISLLLFDLASAQTPVRLAVIDLLDDERREITALLRVSVKESSFELVDPDLTRVAARGAGYTGSLNLTRNEARALGQSLGCDFYILGKVQMARRLASGEQYYFEALAGLFIVETRTGRLIRFSFERVQAESELQAYEQLKDLIRRGWEENASVVVSARDSQSKDIKEIRTRPVIEVLNDESEGKGIEQPFFYQRLKPAYTEQAELALITATVELEAVFGEDGRVGEIEVVRWAGFGLDESAIAAVRLLRFKPATISDGSANGVEKKLTIRGLVRYNFRRPHTQAARPQAQSQEEIDRLKGSLRNIKNLRRNPGQVPEQKPE